MHRNSTISSEPLPTSTCSGCTPCQPASQSRNVASPEAGPYCRTATACFASTCSAAAAISAEGKDSMAGTPRVKLIGSRADMGVFSGEMEGEGPGGAHSMEIAPLHPRTLGLRWPQQPAPDPQGSLHGRQRSLDPPDASPRPGAG